MRIAAVQYHIDHDNKEDNWTRAEEFMATAAKQQVDLIVFPEYFIGGPGPDVVEQAPPDIAVNRFSQLAVKYGMDLVPGSLMERDSVSGKVYNTSHYIDKSGKVLLSYRKTHLWHPEREYMSKGEDGFATARNRFGIEVGLCICWDLAFPEGFREMALKRHAQLIIAPAYWCLEDGGKGAAKYDSFSEVKLLESMCTARCFENGIVLVFCNGAGESDVVRRQPFGTLAGRTQICAPFKGPIAQCEHLKEEMIIADVDIETITRDAEEVYKIREDFEKGLIHNCNSLHKKNRL